MMTELLPDFGTPVMKSMETSVYIEAGKGKGCKVPGSMIVSPLLHWHTSHSATKVRMSCFMLVQKKEWSALA